jgi:hypothetical protein
VYVEIAVTASEPRTMARSIGARKGNCFSIHVSSTPKKVETSGTPDARFAASPSTPCGIGQKAWMASKPPARASRAAAAEPAAT